MTYGHAVLQQLVHDSLQSRMNPSRSIRDRTYHHLFSKTITLLPVRGQVSRGAFDQRTERRIAIISPRASSVGRAPDIGHASIPSAAPLALDIIGNEPVRRG
mgnify:CR=1 FL=1